MYVYIHIYMYLNIHKFAGPMAQSVWDPQLSFVFLTPIAMAIRILPGAFGLELCPLNRNQPTLTFYQRHWFYRGFISISG